jgi:hypothetical protein
VETVGQFSPKRKRSLDRLRWYVDHESLGRGEPGLVHSFVGSLATSIDCAGYVVDPVWLMGVSGFAFRIWVVDRLSPSAMNAFDWESILIGAVHKAGFECTYVEGSPGSPAGDEPTRRTAHGAIVRSIDRGVPAIAWDLNDPPMWGLITGYNDHTAVYDTRASWNYAMPLPYDRLGRRDVERLSVTILGEEREYDEARLVKDALRTAVMHAVGGERTGYRDVTSGLEAYEEWARWISPGSLDAHHLSFADYYAMMFYSFRCYARDFVKRIAAGNRSLQRAAAAYDVVASELQEVYEVVREHLTLPGGMSDRIRHQLAAGILRAKTAEDDAIRNIQAGLADSDLDVSAPRR